MVSSFPKPLENRRILVIEDESDIAELIGLHLRDRYECVELCHNGKQGFDLAKSATWDLIVLDLRLPGMDGLEVCRQLRATENYVPIIMLTSKSSELDHVLGLEMGADDYVTKPFSVMELTSRIKAILRRMSAANSVHSESSDRLAHGGIEILVSKRLVQVDNQQVDLTAKEFALLCYFVRQPGEVFSRAQLLDRVWGDQLGSLDSLKWYISSLRDKIEDNPRKPKSIVTFPRVGYRYSPPTVPLQKD